MQEYIINVSQIEELQTINDLDSLDKIFTRASHTIIGGEKVVLVRSNARGKTEKFDEITTEGDLATYKKSVYKYLS
jgi:hypothetical protein